MANNKDFKVKNGIEPTAYLEALGSVSTSTSVGDFDALSYKQLRTLGRQYSTAMFWKSDGTKLYILNDYTSGAYTAYGYVRELTFATAWDITSAVTAVDWTLPSGFNRDMKGIWLSDDGTKIISGQMYSNTDTLRTYTLSTAWDLSTVGTSYTEVDFNLTGGGFYFKDGGTLYVGTNNSGERLIKKYTLSTDWDITTIASTSDEVDIQNGVGSNNQWVFNFTPDGKQIWFSYHISNANTWVGNYELTTAWDVTTASLANNAIELAQVDGTSDGTFTFKNDGSYVYWFHQITGTTGELTEFKSSIIEASIDFSVASVFYYSATDDTRFIFNSSDAHSQSSLFLDYGASNIVINFPTSVRWPDATAPETGASGDTSIFTFKTTDSGSIYNSLEVIRVTS